MPLRPTVFFSLLSLLVLGTGCPEDVPDDGTGANGSPSAGGDVGGGGIQNGGLSGGGAHDCSNPQITQAALEAQDTESKALIVTGSVTCGTCTGGVTIQVIAPPPEDQSADPADDPHNGCITSKQITDLTSFSVLLPAGLSKVIVQSMDTVSSANWGQVEVPLGAGGAQNVALDTTVKPPGTAMTETGDPLGAPDGDTTGTLPETGDSEGQSPAPKEESSDGSEQGAGQGSAPSED